MLIFSSSLISIRIFCLAITAVILSGIVSCGTIPVPGRQSDSKIIPDKEVNRVNVDNPDKVASNINTLVKAKTANESSIKTSSTLPPPANSYKNREIVATATKIKPGSSPLPENVKEKAVDNKSSNIVKNIENKPDITEKKTSEKRFALAKIKYQAGQYEDAATILEQLTSNYADNIQYRDLLVLTYTKYAEYLENKADLLEAQTILEKALSIQPYNSDLQRQLKALENRGKADRQYAAGIEALKESDQEKAIDAFSQALKLKADHKLAKEQIVLLKTQFADSYHKKAMILYRKQKLDEAIKTWRRVLMLDPEHEMAKLYRARAVELKEKIERL